MGYIDKIQDKNGTISDIHDTGAREILNQKAFVDAIAEEYSILKNYKAGALLTYQGNQYYCIKDAAAGTPPTNTNYFSQKSVADIIDMIEKGIIKVGYSDVADDLTPYSDESGAFQDNPVISQGTGTDNNSAIVTTGNFAQLREKQGNTLAVNQLVAIPSSSITTTKNGVTFTDNRDGTYTVNGTATGGDAVLSVAILLLNGGKRYFLTGNKQTNSNYLLVFISAGSIYATDNGGNAIYTPSSDAYMGVSIVVKENSTASNLKFEPKVVELKQMFNGNIPQDLLDHPDHFSWYYNGSLAYNAGSLENANGVKLVCTHRNLFNGRFSATGKYLNENGQEISQDASLFNITEYIIVPPNKPIWVSKISGAVAYLCFYDKDKNFISSVKWGDISSTKVVTTPPNCTFIRNSITTSEASNLTISLYYTEAEGGEGYSEHYEYKEPTVVDTGSEELLAFDTKDPDGTWHHNTDECTFAGNEYWVSRGSDTNCDYYKTSAEFLPSYARENNIGKLVCSNGYVKGNAYSGNAPYTIFIDNKTVCIAVPTGINPNTAFANGTKLQYELADYAKTTEQGTKYPENVEIDDYGMMYWLNANDELVGIPQGAKFFYPVNYKGFLDDLYNRTEGDAGNVVVEDELIASETARDAVDAQLKAALGGTLRQVLAATQSIDFANTTYVDLGNLTWSYQNTAGHYYFYTDGIASDVKQPSASDVVANILCTKYKSDTTAHVYNNSENKIVAVNNGNGQLRIYDTAYTDATAFKAAMKGVLLAHEKASS